MTARLADRAARACTRVGGASAGKLDPEVIRRDFPILGRPTHGRPLVFLDSASTSQKPRPSSTRSTRYYNEYNANVHRGIYEIGERATATYEAARAKVARSSTRPTARGHLHPQRDRGDQPRRLLVGPPQHRPRRRDRAHRDGAPREPRPVAAPGPGEGRRPRVHPDHRRRRPPPGRLRGPAPPQAEARRVHPCLEHARARSTRSARWSTWPTRPARSCSSTAPRPCPTSRSTSRRSAPTSTPSPATRCSGRRARGRCGRGASCSRRCRRSWPAAT